MVVLGPLSSGAHHQCRSGPTRRGLITTTRDQPGGSAMYDTESRRRTASVRAAPWRAIAMWLVFVAGCFAIGQAAGTHRATDLDQTVGESGRGAHWLHDAGMDDPATESVLISSRSGALDSAAAARAVADVR